MIRVFGYRVAKSRSRLLEFPVSNEGASLV
jgi:hypothetical protein